MLTPWKESYDNLDSILKSRDITLPTKVHLVKAMVFPVVMYGCESWTVKKAEHWRIDAFERWCWRRLLRVPWTARRSNQSILKGISPECSLEGLMLMLKLQYFGQLMWRADSIEKTIGKDWGQEEKGTTEDEMVRWYHWLNEHELAGLRELVMDTEALRAAVQGLQRVRQDLPTELNWTESRNTHWSCATLDCCGGQLFLKTPPLPTSLVYSDFSHMEISSAYMIHDTESNVYFSIILCVFVVVLLIRSVSIYCLSTRCLP